MIGARIASSFLSKVIVPVEKKAPPERSSFGSGTMQRIDEFIGLIAFALQGRS
ncbi:hypothetical protein [Bradyrhizobium sp.]|uniref:hypothetical protein n=1 Tax=Bradyrhizobium sp. TaxID=376 RepID=UPI00273766F5|nr:hypothetical protein [Bradyrhizobium sp.]